MKTLKAIAFVAVLMGAALAGAQTWYYAGVLYGNICRNGAYYTVYPISAGQPVGSVCPLRDNLGNIVGTGYVSNE